MANMTTPDTSLYRKLAADGEGDVVLTKDERETLAKMWRQWEMTLGAVNSLSRQLDEVRGRLEQARRVRPVGDIVRVDDLDETKH